MFKASLLCALVALAHVTGTMGVDTQATSFSVAIPTYSAQGSAVSPVLTFTTVATTASPAGTITVNMPAGYFLGTATFAAGASSVGALAGAASTAATSASNSIVITLSAGATGAGTTDLKITLSGLRLGAVQGAGGCTLQSSGDVTATTSINLPAIVGSIGVSSITIGNNGVNSPVWPVITFTPATNITVGATITIGMPAGYFLGTASFPVGSVALMTGTAASAATETSTSIVITTAGAPSGISAVTITLHGLTLGALANAGHLVFSSSVNTATQAVAVAAIVAAPVFTSFTWGVSGGNNIASTAVTVTLTFTPGTAVTATDFITITMPDRYFTGSGSFLAGNSTIALMTGSIDTTASSNTKFVINPAGADTTTAAFTVTITGLSLGIAQAAGYFSLTTSVLSGSYGMVAPAIYSIITSASITLATNVSGTNPSPVLAFTSTGTIAAGGFVTIQMPAGYFLGTAAFVAGNASVGALTGSAPAVTSTSTSIVITTAAASITTSAFTVTLQGLTLGSARAAGSFILSTSVDGGSVTKTAPAIQAAPEVQAPPSPKASASVLNLSVALLLSIALALFI